MRDWMFSSVMSGARSGEDRASMAPNAATAGSIGISSSRMPSSRAHSAASSRLSRLV